MKQILPGRIKVKLQNNLWNQMLKLRSMCGGKT